MTGEHLELPLLEMRPYQEKVWGRLINDNIKRSILVWHRRAGKDLFSFQVMTVKALLEKGNYWYLLPEQKQVRRAIWEGMTKGGKPYLSYIPEQLIYKKLDNEMKIVLRDINNPTKAGSIISFLGGDRYDSLVGSGIKGAVVSEFALQKPSLYTLVLEPMLRETDGWCLFNTTPRGKNHAYDMFEFLSKDPKSLASLLTIKDTGMVDDKDLNDLRKQGVPEEQIQQEYYCSFEGAIHGSYYNDVLTRNKDKYGLFPYDAAFPVHTCWDLGISDSTAIWFVQFIERTIRAIDYYENSSYGLAHYVNLIRSKPYNYAGHHLPHDGEHRALTPTEKAISVAQQVKNLGLINVDCIPRTHDVYADINAVRAILSRTYFDASKTEDGYEALKQYRREWDESRQRFKDSPLHDWTSHGSDAFRMIPIVEKRCLTAGIKRVAKKWNGNF